jgi:hypothetical protein
MRLTWFLAALLTGHSFSPAARRAQSGLLRIPAAAWSEKSPAELGLNAARLEAARDYALTAGGSGMIVRADTRCSVGAISAAVRSEIDEQIAATLLGVAMLDGKLKPDERAIKYQLTRRAAGGE